MRHDDLQTQRRKSRGSYNRTHLPSRGILELPRFRGHLTIWGGAGQTPEELARKFEPTAQSIRNWLRQADLDDGKRTDGLTTGEREELRQLRREVRTGEGPIRRCGRLRTRLASG